MEVSGQFQALHTLSPGKDLRYALDGRLGPTDFKVGGGDKEGECLLSV